MSEISWQHLKEDGLYTYKYNRNPLETFSVRLDNKGSIHLLTITISNNMEIDDEIINSYNELIKTDKSFMLTSTKQDGDISIKEEYSENNPRRHNPYH